MPRVEWSFLLPAEDHKQVKWFLAYTDIRYTPWGQIVTMITFIGLAISSVGTQISAYLLPSFVLGLLLTSYILSQFFKPKVELKRYLPSSPHAGGSLTYKVVVKNTGRVPIRNLAVLEQVLPYGLYFDRRHEKLNNTIDWLDPGEQASVTLALHVPRRGTFEIVPLWAGTGFPSGVFRSVCKGARKEKFMVYPKIIIPPEMPFEIKQKFQPGGIAVSSKVGLSNEFESTREYRAGDRLKDIHWVSSAKTGKLIVKEHIEEYFNRVGLFVDTELKRFEKHKCFEARISLCAGLADQLYNTDTIVDVFLNDEHLKHVTVGRGVEEFHHLLELLSTIEGDTDVVFETAASKLKEFSQQLSLLIVFLKDWDDPRQRFVETLQNFGLNIRVIIIRDKPLSIQAAGEDINVYKTKQLLNRQ